MVAWSWLKQRGTHRENIQKIGRFIISQEGPYYIHCRLGSDRTGVFSALFAALSGASWEEIVRDYELTGKAGFGEYRNGRLLAYSFRQLLGKAPEDCQDLQQELIGRLLQEQIFTAGEIACIQERLR